MAAARAARAVAPAARSKAMDRVRIGHPAVRDSVGLTSHAEPRLGTVAANRAEPTARYRRPALSEGWRRAHADRGNGHPKRGSAKKGDREMATQSVAIGAVRATNRARTVARDLRLGGGLLVVAGATIRRGTTTAEALYPGVFSTGANEISDLGGTRPPDSVILQPSSTIFNASMTLIGILVMAASWFVHGAWRRWSVTIPIAGLGVGALGV